MSGSDAAKKLKQVFHGLGQPPAPEEADGHLLNPPATRRGRKRKPGKIVQLNLRVPEEVKDRVRLLGARDRMDLSQIVIEAVELYEAKYGAAPKLEPSRRPKA